jgi:uncharacterized protein
MDMGRRRYLILHGWKGNQPMHWQTLLAERLRSEGGQVRYPVLPDFDSPVLTDWMTSLDRELAELREGGGQKTVVCHSLGCILWMHHAARARGPAVDRVMLVAPPGPNTGIEELAPFFPVPLEPDPIAAAASSTLLVHSDNDPYCSPDAGATYGVPLRIPRVVIPGTAHLNVEAGFGPWPEMEAWALDGSGFEESTR